MKIGIICPELGLRGGISTFSYRLGRYLKQAGCEVVYGINDIREAVDVKIIEYEPGIYPTVNLKKYLEEHKDEPIILEFHNTVQAKMLAKLAHFSIFHAEHSIPEDWPGHYKLIPHPALVYPEKDKDILRRKFNLPREKRILGTGGFLHGIWKGWHTVLEPLLRNLDSDEFVYFATSAWIEGDGGVIGMFRHIARKLGKTAQFRVESDFMPDEIVNERYQACDMLFAWNSTPPNYIYSSSGLICDLYGARRHVVVRDIPHHWHLRGLKGVTMAPTEVDDFVDVVLKCFRDEKKLNERPEPEHLSWEVLIKEWIDYAEFVMSQY